MRSLAVTGNANQSRRNGIPRKVFIAVNCIILLALRLDLPKADSFTHDSFFL